MPDAFASDDPREVNERLEAAKIRQAILEGYEDAIAGRTVVYSGNLRQLLDADPFQAPPAPPG